MSLDVLVNLASLARGSSGTITGEVYVAAGEIRFPAKDWNDFPVVIIGWWLVAMRDISTGRGQDSLMFMDGPYDVAVVPVDSEKAWLQFRRGDAVEHTVLGSLSDLGQAVLRAADQLEKACADRGWTGADVDILRRTMNDFREAMPHPEGGRDGRL